MPKRADIHKILIIGKTYKEAFQKAIRSLEINRYGLGFAKNFHKLSPDELLAAGVSRQYCPAARSLTAAFD